VQIKDRIDSKQKGKGQESNRKGKKKTTLMKEIQDRETVITRLRRNRRMGNKHLKERQRWKQKR